jgi:hypothetical protein
MYDRVKNEDNDNDKAVLMAWPPALRSGTREWLRTLASVTALPWASPAWVAGAPPGTLEAVRDLC